jgi:hypothetical protein
MKRDDGLKFFIAQNGRDSWSGTLPNPDTDFNDGPFATLERARDAVRESRSANAEDTPVTVMIREGVHRRTTPFVLRPEDSGTDDAPVTYTAYPGEKPVISGGRIISGFQSADSHLWTVELPAVRDGQWNFTQLFIDGRRRTRARYPADTVSYPNDGLIRVASEGVLKIEGESDIATAGWAGDIGDSVTDDDIFRRSFSFQPGDIRRDWRNIEDVEVVVLQMWTAARLRIQEVDEEKHSVLFTGGGWRPLTWSFGYYIDNLFEGLDVPGAWYLDKPRGVLYYHPLPDEDMDRIEIVAPVTEQLVRFDGDVDAQRFVHDIVFSQLKFQHTTRPSPASGYACPQAEISNPAAITAEGAERCRIENCDLAHCGAWGIEFGRGCHDNAISDNTITDLGAGCIKLGEKKDAATDVEEAYGALVTNNRLSGGGKIYHGPAAVWVGQSSHNTISHNEISGGFQWGVSVGWNWEYFPLNRARDNIVEFNHIHHIGTGILGTHGAIYCLGVSPGTVVRNNYIHHVYSNDRWGAGEGKILDNGCVGILIENNVVHDASAGGFGCNFNCLGCIIINNIFAFGVKYQLTRYGDPPDFGRGGTPPPNGEIFSRNIVTWKEGPLIMESDWWSFATLWDYNLYFQIDAEPVRFMKYSLDEWREKGLDKNSMIADPLFVAPDKGNFSLQPESPALTLGFKPIDLVNVGPQAVQKS